MVKYGTYFRVFTVSLKDMKVKTIEKQLNNLTKAQTINK